MLYFLQTSKWLNLMAYGEMNTKNKSSHSYNANVRIVFSQVLKRQLLIFFCCALFLAYFQPCCYVLQVHNHIPEL